MENFVNLPCISYKFGFIPNQTILNKEFTIATCLECIPNKSSVRLDIF